jgi:hypothetical protein
VTNLGEFALLAAFVVFFVVLPVAGVVSVVRDARRGWSCAGKGR